LVCYYSKAPTDTVYNEGIFPICGGEERRGRGGEREIDFMSPDVFLRTLASSGGPPS
jgi:hypothetical protein